MRAAGPGQSALVLLDVIEILKTFHVPYAIIGAFAASFHGVVRASLDADALISFHAGQTEITALINAIRKAGLKSRYRKGEARDPIGGVIAIEDRFHNRVDLLMKIRGMTDAVFSRTVEAEFMNERIRVIGVEDFIAMKVFAGSSKDVSDIVGVLRVSYDRVNVALLKQLVQPYGKDARRTLDSLLRQHAS